MTKTVDSTELELITQTARDYFEGWFDGDVGGWTARSIPTSSSAARAGRPDSLDTTKERMLELTRAGEGTEDGADRRIDIRVEDVERGHRERTVRSAVYHEYLHLVRTPSRLEDRERAVAST